MIERLHLPLKEIFTSRNTSTFASLKVAIAQCIAKTRQEHARFPICGF